MEAKINHQNDRMLGKCRESISKDHQKMERSQKPRSIMVWAAVSESWKSSLIFVQPGAKINGI